MGINKIEMAKEILKEIYQKDSRPLCISFSGGKDSSALIFLMIDVLMQIPNTKQTYVINSNTMAELPPLLNHLHKSIYQINRFVIKNNLKVKVIEVKPETKDTLNVQLLGVGMPPPTPMFRWCTDKLKVNPIDKKLKELFPDGMFVSVIGTRKDESADRAKRISSLSIKNSYLKINDRYPNASNVMPLEDWSTKDIWEFLLSRDNSIIDVDFLWKLYSDASNKDASECSFVGAGVSI